MKPVLALSLMTTCIGLGIQGTASAAPFAVPAETKTQGKIFDSASSNTVPSFFYETTRRKDGSLLISTTIYRDRAGKVLVEENTTYENGNLLRYTYDQKQVKESGEIELKNGKASYRFRPAGKEEETDSESIDANMIVPDMVPAVVQRYWKELIGGESVKTRFLVLERQDSFGFKFYKDKERELNGIAVVDFILKPSSFFIAAIAPTIRITMEKAEPHRPLEMQGILPVRVPEKFPPKKRSDYHALDGLLRFDL